MTTDSMIALSERMVALQAENEQLRAKLEAWKYNHGIAQQAFYDMEKDRDELRAKIAEHELLFGVALTTDDLLDQLLTGLANQLPDGTPRTATAIVAAVADMALKLDAHEDASTPAFDEIVKLCGLAKTWEYPGQVIRDVEDALKKRDDLIAGFTKEKSEWDEHYQSMRACIVYARDRRGKSFVFEDWEAMVEYALRGGCLPPHAVEDAQAKEEQAWAAVTKIREDRDFWKGQANALTPAHVALQDKLRIAEAVRDDARAASQRYLDEKREVQALLANEQEKTRVTRAERDRLQRMLDTAEELRAARPTEEDVVALRAEIRTLRNEKIGRAHV